MSEARNYYDYVMGHVRLAVLRALEAAPGYAANDSVLTSEMDRLGFQITRDQLRGQVAWLEEQGLIEVARPSGSLLAAKLRERGADVAVGRVTIDGIQRPSPGR